MTPLCGGDAAKTMQSFLHSVGEAMTPVLKNSKFKETGVLTPEEVLIGLVAALEHTYARYMGWLRPMVF